MLSTQTFTSRPALFQVKGIAYRGLLLSLQDRIEGTVERFLSELADEGLRKFFEQTFLASVWYDVYPLHRATPAATRAIGLTEAEGLRQLTRTNAERDVSGVYRTLLQVSSPEQLGARLQRLNSTLFDFGTINIQREAPRCIDCIASGVPIVIAEWYGCMLSEYVKQALRLTHILNPSCRVGVSPPTGQERGSPVARIQLEWTW
jgi:hypothetical protein